MMCVYVCISVCKAEHIFITWVAGDQKMAAELNSIRFTFIGEDNVSILKVRQEQLRIVQGEDTIFPIAIVSTHKSNYSQKNTTQYNCTLLHYEGGQLP